MENQNTEKMQLIEAALLESVSGAGASADIDICGASCHIFSIDVCRIDLCRIPF